MVDQLLAPRSPGRGCNSPGRPLYSANVIWLFAFAARVRKIISTTNAIESLHSGVRKSIRNKGRFPRDEAATKLIWLALRNLKVKWKNPPRVWSAAKAQFGGRFRLDEWLSFRWRQFQ